MNHKNYTNNATARCRTLGWKLMVSLMMVLMTSIKMYAAVSAYTFSQNAAGTYVPLTAARSVVFLATASATSDPGLGDDRIFNLASGTIPFSFTFNGTAYTGINISTNGFITFGATAPGTTVYTCISNTTAYSGAIAALSRDQSGNTAAANLGEISYEVLGTGTNRTFVIQWAKFRRFSSSATFTENYNYQIRLNEGGGVTTAQTIDIVYGACTSTTTTSSTTIPQVGLRGATNADFNDRTTTTSWTASTLGGTNAVSMRHTTTVNPATGLTFTYTPPSGCTVATGGTITPATFSKCAGTTYTMASTGFSGGTGTTYQWKSSLTNGGPYADVVGGTGATTTSYTTPSLTTGVYYYVMVTTCSGCGPCSNTSSQLTLTVNALPTVTATPSSGSICSPGGSPVSITAGGASTYTWSPTTGLTPTTGSPVSANPTASTTYTVTGTDANGCTGTATSAITIAPAVILSSVTATPNNVCSGGTSTLQANAGFPTPTYCASTHASGCSGDEVNHVVLTDVSPSTIIDNVTGATCGGTSHQSYFPGTNILDVGATPHVLSLSFGSDGSQYFGAWIDYDQNGVFSASEFLGASANAGSSGTIGVTFSVPVLAFNGKTRMRIVGGNDSPVTSGQACGASSSGFGETQDYDVTIVNGSPIPFTYLWSESPAGSTLSSTSTNPVDANGITVNKTYSVTVTSAAGCSATGSVAVTSGAPLACVNITNTPACENTDYTLTANTTGGGAPFSYSWYCDGNPLPSTSSTAVVNHAAGTYNYYVTVTDGCGGSCTMYSTVTVYALPGGVASGPATGFTSTPLTYTVTGYIAGSIFQWKTATVSGGPYTDVAGPQTDNQNITFTSTGTKYVIVVVTGPSGCTSTSNEITTVIALAGDAVCDAIPIVVGINGTYTNVGATTQTGEPAPGGTGCNNQTGWCSGQVPSHSIWFSFVAPASGRISLHFSPGNWDSQLALWDAATCNDLLDPSTRTLIAANDDSASSPYNAYIAPICVIPGHTYFVQVDGYSTTTNAAFGIELKEESIDDANGCTIDACPAPGSTVTHTPVSTDDNNVCTTDACDPATGTITHTPIGFDDNNVCTTDGCDPITGIYHTAISCDDNDACTTDGCDPVTGCTHTAVNCDDNNVCTIDGCDPLTGCTHTAISCDDNNVCTTDGCDPVTGCTHTAISCDDNDVCTTDGCDPLTGCTHTAISCDDNDASTTDGCDPITGCYHNTISCDDNNVCTIDATDPILGCTHTPVNVNDNNVCTTDGCDPITGIYHTAISCDDNNVCTTDGCDPVTGCTHTAISCDDNNVCTTDGCDPISGCTHTAISCDDNNVCTTDGCDPVTGCYHNAISIDDNNVCTTDACDPITGTTHTAISCDDHKHL